MDWLNTERNHHWLTRVSQTSHVVSEDVRGPVGCFFSMIFFLNQSTRNHKTSYKSCHAKQTFRFLYSQYSGGQKARLPLKMALSYGTWNLGVVLISCIIKHLPTPRVFFFGLFPNTVRPAEPGPSGRGRSLSASHRRSTPTSRWATPRTCGPSRAPRRGDRD